MLLHGMLLQAGITHSCSYQTDPWLLGIETVRETSQELILSKERGTLPVKSVQSLLHEHKLLLPESRRNVGCCCPQLLGLLGLLALLALLALGTPLRCSSGCTLGPRTATLRAGWRGWRLGPRRRGRGSPDARLEARPKLRGLVGGGVGAGAGRNGAETLLCLCLCGS